MKHPPTGTTVWLVKTNYGFLDRCLYKTFGAMLPTRNYYWRTEHGATRAFQTIENRFPRLGPRYELWEGVIAEFTAGRITPHAQPVRMIDHKTT
jgi:hypothetical protein